MASFHLDIVTAEDQIFSGLATKLFVTGVMGELEVLSGHAPLLTSLAPGPLWVVDSENREHAFVIFGGTLEVHAKGTIVLADAAIRSEDIDEAAASKAKQNSEQALLHRHEGPMDYHKAQGDLLVAVAQLRVLRRLRSLTKAK